MGVDFKIMFYCALVIIVVLLFYLLRARATVDHLEWLKKSCESATAKVQNSLESKSRALDLAQKRLEQFENDSTSIVNEKINVAVSSLACRCPFKSNYVFKYISSPEFIEDQRFIKAYNDTSMRIVEPPLVSVKLRGQSGDIYDVSLDSCTCEDYRRRKQPCKHMYKLAMYIGALSVADSAGINGKVNDTIHEYIDIIDEANNAKRAAEKKIAAINKEREDSLNRISTEKKKYEQKLTDLRKRNEQFINSLKEYGYNSTWLAKMYGDYYDMFIGNMISDLENRVRPAHATAARIEKNYKEEMKSLAARAKHSESLVFLYESFYPNLPALCDMTADDIPPSLDEPLDLEPKAEYESMRKWISRSEYDLLPRVEKYQLALDNYKHRNRSNWAAGIDFERYICYLYELKGYRVVCFGALNGVADLGRDLYAFKDSEVIIIQCKRWSAQKLIHEKHVYQLFGTVTDYCIENPLFNTHGLLIATCNLSDKAREVAGRIGIEFEENVSFPEYPMVKCNINRATGEKIYHLPFDQQYDKVQIEYDKGEFYAWTVSEAERKGFRRAFRHIINSAAEH